MFDTLWSIYIKTPFLGFIISSILFIYGWNKHKIFSGLVEKNKKSLIKYRILGFSSALYLLVLCLIGYWILRFFVRDLMWIFNSF